MDRFIEIFIPENFYFWLRNSILLIATAYIILWAISLILSRILFQESAILSVYFGWLIGLMFMSVSGSFFIVVLSAQYKVFFVPLYYSILFLIPIILNSLVGYYIYNRIVNFLKTKFNKDMN